MAKYEPIYVYADALHPKRGGRCGHHFKVTGRYRDIIKVVWMTDKEAGYVREGEFKTIEEWRSGEGLALKREFEARERQRAEGRRMWEEIAEIMHNESIWVGCHFHMYRVEQAKADAFRLESV